MSAHFFEETVAGRRPWLIDLRKHAIITNIGIDRTALLRRRLTSDFIYDFFKSLVLTAASPSIGRVPFVTQRFLRVR